MPGGMENATRRLLDRPQSSLSEARVLMVHEKGFQWMTELVARCSDTFEYLNVGVTHPVRLV